MGRVIFMLCIWLWAITMARAEDPYLFFTWNVTYGTISPLGVPQQGILINGQFPGPNINSTTNNNIVLNVFNNIDEPILFTWLGIQQRKNSWQDGVLGTNCPILPGTNFTYRFQVKDQIGSYFYYPTTTIHRAAGGFGGLRVNSRLLIPVPYADPEDDYTILIGDWYTKSHSILRKFLDIGRSLGRPDGVLINGKSAKGDGSDEPLFTMKPGKTYKYRICNVGLKNSLNFRIQGHPLKLVEMEGSHTVQNTYESLDVHVGQCFAVLVTADKAPKDYLVVASTRFTKNVLTGKGIIRYTNAKPAPPSPDVVEAPVGWAWSLNQFRSFRWNLTSSAARPNPQGSYHYGKINITRTIKLVNSAVRVQGKLRYAMNGVSHVDPYTPLKLAEYYQVADNTKLPDDVWGGDAYSWLSLDKPASYGSRGGSTSKEVEYGGEGGGRIWMEVDGTVDVCGSVLADGGYGGLKGGGGSGGSIYIKARRMTGSGRISAAGGDGFAGGGGGRVSINVFSRHDHTQFFVHGGRSLGCTENSGAAGTYYDAVPRSLTVSNHNMSTQTDTLMWEFPKQPLWTNVYIRDHAKALVPLYWSRVQVQGQIHLSCGATLSFGLAHYSSSEFELMAEELLMSDSVVKIFGALRMSVKIYLMWKSKMLIDGGSDAIVATSFLEASNIVVLKESSVIQSTTNLGVHGQGFLNLSGPGNLIEAQRLVLSLFFSINVGLGSFLRGPLESANSNYMTPRLYCHLPDCPVELIHPPEDCNVNSTLAFTIQICRVEVVAVEGTITGSVIHFHLVRAMIIPSSGLISASGLGCYGGVGRGKMFENGLAGGGGHGGKGGDGYYNGKFIEGGIMYGDAGLPCELGSGSGNNSLAGATAGGGIIVIGSLEHSLSSLSIEGSLKADGESFGEDLTKQNHRSISKIGPGGGSGGTILLFVNTLALGNSSTISTVGGHGSPNGGGGGGGGRVHFHWSEIPIGDAYLPIARVKGSILTGGGYGRGRGCAGQNGTVTGKACPEGLYGIFCEECPVGTYKNVSGSDRALCFDCPFYELPNRAMYVTVRGGVTETPCPYKCISDRYRMPNCYTALEELVYTFGGPWWFGFILLGILILLALVLSVARTKYVGVDEVPTLVPARHCSPIDHSFPFLESLNEVLETNRNEESQNHVHRMYFMGPNTFSEPWYLPHSPPHQIKEIVYEDAFIRFVDEINGLAAYQWWEGSIYSILSVLAYPLAWLWLQRCRKYKLQQLREYVRSEYDHACLRSCRSRALYEGLKVAATSDLMLAYVDFFLGGDEKRADLPTRLHQRFPMSIVFGGDGSYMAPFFLHSDNILTSLMSQSIPPTIWYRLVAGLNAQLRLVRRGHLKITFSHVVSWLGTHANPTLRTYGVHVDLAWFQSTAFGYCQFGLVVCAAQNENMLPSLESPNISLLTGEESCMLGLDRVDQLDHMKTNEHLTTHKRLFGGLLHSQNLRTLKEKKTICYPLSFIVYNTKPVGHQDLVGLLISILLLADVSLVSLSFLQQYSISLLNFFLVLFIFPLGLLFPFPAGISALFSQGPRRSAGLARVYALWNITSLINVVVAFLCGLLHYKTHSSKKHSDFPSWNFSMDESEWWVLPSGLAVCKLIQAQLIDRHVANQEIQDPSLYSNDSDVFWQS